MVPKECTQKFTFGGREGSEGYDIIIIAGQSNAMGYGEGTPLLDWEENEYVKQMSRKNYGEIVPATPSLEHIQRIPNINNKKDPKKLGMVGIGFHLGEKIAREFKRKTIFIACARGGSGFGSGSAGSFTVEKGATTDSGKWGENTSLEKDLLHSTDLILNAHKDNKLIGIIWIQGENDLNNLAYANAHKASFEGMVMRFRSELGGKHCPSKFLNKDVKEVPWFCGTSAPYFKQNKNYNIIFGDNGSYTNNSIPNIYLVNLVKPDGTELSTNDALDIDRPPNYYGAKHVIKRSSSVYHSHFGSWAIQTDMTNIFFDQFEEKVYTPLLLEEKKYLESQNRSLKVFFEKNSKKIIIGSIISSIVIIALVTFIILYRKKRLPTGNKTSKDSNSSPKKEVVEDSLPPPPLPPPPYSSVNSKSFPPPPPPPPLPNFNIKGGNLSETTMQYNDIVHYNMVEEPFLYT